MEQLAIKPKYVWWDVDCLNVHRGGDPYEYRWIIESALNKNYGDGPVTIFAIGNMNRIPLRVLELISLAGIVIKHTTTDTKQHENTPRPWQELHGKCCETDWECLLCSFKCQGFTDFTTHLKTRDHLHLEWLLEDELHSKLMKRGGMPPKSRRPKRKRIANPAMVKFLSEPPHQDDVDSFKAALSNLSRDYSVVQPGNDLVSPHTMSRNLEAAGPREALLPYRPKRSVKVTLVDVFYT